MNNAVYYVLVIVAGYFCGCIESGYLRKIMRNGYP